ncbi:hypothetical protein [Methanobrevibacter sp.]|uniref:zinc ribbon domain-containing protein n=1 Tax=Methanobrevibacter sp. TaxID=66852 RepID=UPI003865B2FC
MTKICNNCGNEVYDEANFCPECKCTTFRYTGELVEPKDDVIHRMFYWNYPQGSILAKSKLSGIVMFISMAAFAYATSPSIPVAIIFGAIFGVITFLLGFIIHKIKGEPQPNKLIFNDYGLIKDLKHLFFYWQTPNGGYVQSKTKIFSFCIFLGAFGIGLFTFNNLIIFSAILFALIFEVPAFAIGFGIHKITSDDSNVKPELPKRPKKEIEKKKKIPKITTRRTKSDIIPEYLDYQLQLDDLNKKFTSKEKSTRDLIAKRFEPPQLTYTRFITGVDKSSQLFKKHRDSAYTMISLADEYSPRIASEIEAKIGILKEITEKLDSLSNELIVKDSLTTTEEVDDLIGEMDNLIHSVKDYE